MIDELRTQKAIYWVICLCSICAKMYGYIRIDIKCNDCNYNALIVKEGKAQWYCWEHALKDFLEEHAKHSKPYEPLAWRDL